MARPLLRAAMACGPVIRNPCEQEWSARLTRDALLHKLEVRVLRSFQASFARLLRAFGVRSTDGPIGVSATGSQDAPTLQRLLDGAEGGTWELVCNPGYNDSDLDVTALACLSGRLQLLSFHPHPQATVGLVPAPGWSV